MTCCALLCNIALFPIGKHNMFIRKKPNPSGSTSVLLVRGERIAGKKHSVSRIVKNFGSTDNDVALQALIQQAETYKANIEAISPKARVLKLVSDLDINSCRSYNTGFSDIYGTMFDKVLSGLNVSASLKDKLRNLLTMRIAAPASKLKTSKLALEYNINLNVDTIYKSMDQITSAVIDDAKKIIYEHTKQLLVKQKITTDVLFYDLTTLYFETSNPNELCDFGFSKDGKHQHVQIMLAVIVTKDGLPIDYKEFPGNCYEGHTLIPVLNSLEERFNIDNVVLVADAALMNNINLKELDQRSIKYIIAARIKNADKETKSTILETDSYEIIKTITNNDGSKDQIKAKVIDLKEDQLVAYHCSKRARKDEHDRDKALEKIKKYIHSSAKNRLTGSLRKPYVKITKSSKIGIDLDKFNKEKQYDGFFGLRTNIKQPNPIELLSSYHGLWQVEQTFRIAKTNLEIRPVFHYTPDRIKAHILICYMALALVRYVEFTLKINDHHIPYEQLHLLLSRMWRVRITDSNKMLFEITEDPPPELIPVYKALKINWPNKFNNIATL